MSKFLQLIKEGLSEVGSDGISHFKSRLIRSITLGKEIELEENPPEYDILCKLDGKQFRISIEPVHTEDQEEVYSIAAKTNPNAANSLKQLGKQIEVSAKAAQANLLKQQRNQNRL